MEWNESGRDDRARPGLHNKPLCVQSHVSKSLNQRNATYTHPHVLNIYGVYVRYWDGIENGMHDRARPGLHNELLSVYSHPNHLEE